MLPPFLNILVTLLMKGLTLTPEKVPAVSSGESWPGKVMCIWYKSAAVLFSLVNCFTCCSFTVVMQEENQCRLFARAFQRAHYKTPGVPQYQGPAFLALLE